MIEGGAQMSDDIIDTRRHLDIEGAYNVRDLGGYATSDGRRTRWGVFLRADSLHRLPLRSQAALIDYGIRTVIDLRRSREIQAEPNVFWASSDVRYYHQNMSGDVPIVRDSDLPLPTDIVGRSAGHYARGLDLRQSQTHDILANMAQPDILPALFHCRGGQDRTGIVAALLLGLAGVPDETIAEDYALTSRFLVNMRLDEQPELAGAGYTWQQYQRENCPPEVMLRTLDHLSPNPPKDTDGRREESGRGVRELQGK